MEYYTFIRPDELSNIKLEDIFVKEQKVFISSIISKNRRDGMVGLNDEIIKLMIDLRIFEYSSNHYLFGGSDFKPGIKRLIPVSSGTTSIKCVLYSNSQILISFIL